MGNRNYRRFSKGKPYKRTEHMLLRTSAILTRRSSCFNAWKTYILFSILAASMNRDSPAKGKLLREERDWQLFPTWCPPSIWDYNFHHPDHWLCCLRLVGDGSPATSGGNQVGKSCPGSSQDHPEWSGAVNGGRKILKHAGGKEMGEERKGDDAGKTLFLASSPSSPLFTAWA